MFEPQLCPQTNERLGSGAGCRVTNAFVCCMYYFSPFNTLFDDDSGVPSCSQNQLLLRKTYIITPKKIMPNTAALHLCYHQSYFAIRPRQICIILNNNTFRRVAISCFRGASGGCQVDPRSTAFLRKTLVITTTVRSRD